MPQEPQKNPEIKNPTDPNPNPNDSRKAFEPFTADSYAAALKRAKENSVPKKDYEDLKAEHLKLINDMVEGKNPTFNVDTTKPEKVATQDLIKKILNDRNLSNREFVKTALQMRQQRLEEGKPDVFAPLGHRRPTTHEESLVAERVAKELQDCVDRSNDDAQFNDLLRYKLR